MRHEVDDDTAVRLRRALAMVNRRLRVSAQVQGLTPNDVACLATIDAHGPMRASEVAARERLHPTLLSRTLAKLAELGFVDRRVDPEDGRAALLEITEEGQVAFRRMQAERTELLQNILDGLDPAAVRAILEALPALEAMAQDPHPL